MRCWAVPAIKLFLRQNRHQQDHVPCGPIRFSVVYHGVSHLLEQLALNQIGPEGPLCNIPCQKAYYMTLTSVPLRHKPKATGMALFLCQGPAPRLFKPHCFSGDRGVKLWLSQLCSGSWAVRHSDQSTPSNRRCRAEKAQLAESHKPAPAYHPRHRSTDMYSQSMHL